MSSYLVNNISWQGVSANIEKLAAMQWFFFPTNTKGLCQFCGFTRYYLKSVKNYGQVAVTLTNMLKKHAFV